MTITVGTPATKVYPQDLYPMVVTRVSDSGKTIWLSMLLTVNVETGHAPAYFNGPWPVWDHTYTPEEVEDFTYGHRLTHKATLRKDGTWKISGTQTPVKVGTARYRRDYSY